MPTQTTKEGSSPLGFARLHLSRHRQVLTAARLEVPTTDIQSSSFLYGYLLLLRSNQMLPEFGNYFVKGGFRPTAVVLILNYESLVRAVLCNFSY